MALSTSEGMTIPKALSRAIEQQTAKLPSDAFLWAAGASIVASPTLELMGHGHASVFVGDGHPHC